MTKRQVSFNRSLSRFFFFSPFLFLSLGYDKRQSFLRFFKEQYGEKIVYVSICVWLVSVWLNRTHSEQNRRYKALHVPNISIVRFSSHLVWLENKRKLLFENSIINRDYLYFQKSWLNCHFFLLTKLRFANLLPRSLPFLIVEQQRQRWRRRWRG